MSASKVTVVSNASYPLTLSNGQTLAPGEVVKTEQNDTVDGLLDMGLLVLVPSEDKPETPAVKTPRASAQSDSETQEK